MCRVLALVHLLLSPVISISLVNNRNTIALPRYGNRDRMPKQFLQLDAQRAIYVGLIHLLYRHSWNIRPISLLGVMSNQPDILNGETPEWELVSGQNNCSNILHYAPLFPPSSFHSRGHLQKLNLWLQVPHLVVESHGTYPRPYHVFYQ